MKIVVAPDSFKGSLDALEVCNCVEKGIKEVFQAAEIKKIPLADGGEGTVAALVMALKGEIIKCQVTGPMGEPVVAEYGIIDNGRTAVIEMAAASGLPLVPISKRDPMRATTFGTGELILAALEQGCREFIIGIGGSATIDGGVGMAQALGARFYDKNKRLIGRGGKILKEIAVIDIKSIDSRIKDANFIIANDVVNPLYGKNGAAYIYGPQKGADDLMIKDLDNGLKNLAYIINQDLGKDIANLKGAGAAGGLGAGLVAFLDAKMQLGIELITNKIRLKEELCDADYIITGEGKIDMQTMDGKVPGGVAQIARELKIPVIAIAGSLADDCFVNHIKGIDVLFSIINYPLTNKEAMDKEKTKFFIQKNIEEIFRLIKIAQSKECG